MQYEIKNYVVKLPLDIKEKWLEALRSGRYRQGKNCLRNLYDEYCCIGVLLDVIDPTRWIRKENCYSWENEDAVLPKSLQNQYGLKSTIIIEPLKTQYKDDNYDRCTINDLTCANDVACYNFKQIADIIEQQL